jgi:hypothetical protein
VTEKVRPHIQTLEPPDRYTDAQIYRAAIICLELGGVRFVLLEPPQQP